MTVRLIKPTDEQWRVIPGYAPYEASTFGRIKSPSGKVLTPSLHGPKRKQYLSIYVGGGRVAGKKEVHELILKTFIGERPNGFLGLHSDDVSTNNHVSNLYWGTASDNTKDQIRNGNYSQNLDTTKYDIEIVKKIASEYTGKRGEQSALARKYGMSISNVHLIVHNKTRVL